MMTAVMWDLGSHLGVSLYLNLIFQWIFSKNKLRLPHILYIADSVLSKDRAALFRSKKAPLEKSLSIQEPLVFMMTAVMWDLGSHLGVSLYLNFDISLDFFFFIYWDYHISCT